MSDVSSDDSKKGKLIMEPKKDKSHSKGTRMAAGALKKKKGTNDEEKKKDDEQQRIFKISCAGPAVPAV